MKTWGDFKKISKNFLTVEVAVRTCGSISLFFSVNRDVSVRKVYNVLDHRINSKYPILDFSTIYLRLACHPLFFNGSLET